MTTASIKDVSNMAGITPVTTNAKTKNVQNGSNQFDKLFQKQMDQPSKNVEQKKLSKAPMSSVKKSIDQKQDASVNEVSQEEPEDDLKTVEEVASAFMTQLSELLGVDVEELEEKLETFGITETDLLQSDVLGQFFMDFNQISDSTQLLTDEALYAQYQEVFNLQDEAITQMTELSAKDAANLETIMSSQTAVERVQNLSAEEPAEEEVAPVIEIVRNAPTEDENETQVLVRQENGRQAERDQSKATSEKEPNMTFSNQMDQQLRFDQLNAQMQTENVMHTTDVDTQDIMNQIMDYMKITLDSDMDSLEMQLHPASLGTLQIQVTSKGGVMTANFVTQNEAVKQALESQMMTLQDSLNEQGIKVEAVEVSVATNSFDENLEQGREEQGRNGGHRGRSRRFRGVANVGTDNLKEMKPQEQLAAKIRSANQGV